MTRSHEDEDNVIGRRLKRVLMAVLFVATVACYVLQEFHPEQPLHHELNGAGGVLIVAFLLCWWFL